MTGKRITVNYNGIQLGYTNTGIMSIQTEEAFAIFFFFKFLKCYKMA